ncbi:hypothetical protein [Vitreimonas sp.]|uniref:hypothetical protein n=1 Tax=Vitreimonas sp. TaxID=3069702 RepID=UPI002D78230B|nr:hypothetical protein [Vitreimonas sp.]
MAHRLCAAGAVKRVARVGHAPFGGDDPIEIAFENGVIFAIEVGFESATDVQIFEGTVFENAYGHLRTEEPETFAAIARDWSSEDIDLPWLIGAALSNPRRLAMTNPYRVDVGYVFDAAGRQFALFGEADYIWAADLADEDLAQFRLEIGAPV